MGGTQDGGSGGVEIDFLCSGQYFGERALLKQEPRMASVQAKTVLKCLSLTKEAFEQLNLSSSVKWRRRPHSIHAARVVGTPHD